MFLAYLYPLPPHLILTDCVLLYSIAHFPPSDYEELVLNSLTTFNNLSYYAQTQSYVVKRQEEIAGCKPLGSWGGGEGGKEREKGKKSLMHHVWYN